MDTIEIRPATPAAQAVEYQEFEEWHAARRAVIGTALATLDKALSLS